MTFPPVLGQCPVCRGELVVKRLQCPACQTAVEGQFRLGRYASLAPDQLAFLDVFVRNRGIIKDVEAELGLSYRTVVGRLDDLLRALEHLPDGDTAPRPREVRESAAHERQRILADLKSGLISAEEASKRLEAGARRPAVATATRPEGGGHDGNEDRRR